MHKGFSTPAQTIARFAANIRCDQSDRKLAVGLKIAAAIKSTRKAGKFG